MQINRKISAYLILPASVVTMVLIVYYTIKYDETRSFVCHFIPGHALTIISRPGVLSYVICVILLVLFLAALFLLIMEMRGNGKKKSRSPKAAKRKKSIRLVPFLLACLMIIGLLELFFIFAIRKSYEKVAIDLRSGKIEVKGLSRDYIFPLATVDCFYAAIVKSGRHNFLKIYVSAREYPPGITASYNWSSARGLDVLTHSVDMVQDRGGYADEINGYIRSLGIPVDCPR